MESTHFLFACLAAAIFFSGCTSDGIGKSVDTIQVRYMGCWSGAVGNVGSTSSVEGCGDKSWPISGSIVSANFQKQDDGAGQLCARLLFKGNVVKESCTTAGYGIAQVAS